MTVRDLDSYEADVDAVRERLLTSYWAPLDHLVVDETRHRAVLAERYADYMIALAAWEAVVAREEAEAELAEHYRDQDAA